MPVATAEVNAGESRRTSDVGKLNLNVRHGPESRQSSAVDWAVVNRKPVHGRRPFRNYQRSGYPFRRCCVLDEPEIDKLTDVAGHKFALRSGVAALLCPGRNGTGLQDDAQWLDIGRLAAIELELDDVIVLAE